MTKTHDIVATIGSYKKDGEEKKRYHNCGSMFTEPDGRMSIKLDAVPVGPEWSGWLSCYPTDKAEGKRPSPSPSTRSQQSEDGDDIPF